jgi:hypothetical protein
MQSEGYAGVPRAISSFRFESRDLAEVRTAIVTQGIIISRPSMACTQCLVCGAVSWFLEHSTADGALGTGSPITRLHLKHITITTARRYGQSQSCSGTRRAFWRACIIPCAYRSWWRSPFYALSSCSKTILDRRQGSKLTVSLPI